MSFTVFHQLLMWLLIIISLHRINALKNHLEYKIFMYYKLHLRTFVLSSLQILEVSDYILKHYHHLHNICHRGSSEIPFCLKFDKYTKLNHETIKWYEISSSLLLLSFIPLQIKYSNSYWMLNLSYRYTSSKDFHRNYKHDLPWQPSIKSQ